MAAERKKVMTGATTEENTVIIKNLVKVLHLECACKLSLKHTCICLQQYAIFCCMFVLGIPQVSRWVYVEAS